MLAPCKGPFKDIEHRLGACSALHLTGQQSHASNLVLVDAICIALTDIKLGVRGRSEGNASIRRPD